MTTYHEDESARIIHGDALKLSELIEPESVDLIVTSPPFFALRSYRDGDEHYDGQIGSEATPQDFLAALWAVTEQCQRVLKPGGSLFVNLGDKYGDKSLLGMPWRYAIGCTDGMAGDSWVLRSEIIWSKPNGLPESVTDRVRRSHEQWFHFTRHPSYFASVDEIREPHKTTDAENKALRDRGPYMGGKQNTDRADLGAAGFAGNPLGRLPGSVWTVPLEPLRVPEWLGVDHFAAFPQEWPRRIIKGWTPIGYCVECGEPRRAVTEKNRVGVSVRSSDVTQIAGGSIGGGGFALAGAETWQRTDLTITGYACACDNTDAQTRPAVVLDPFCGTGTVPMVARALGRYGVGVDLSRDYLKLAKWRIWESGHAAKSVARMNQERQTSLGLEIA